MKYYLLIILLTSISIVSLSQNRNASPIPISFGYFGHKIKHPGIRLGTVFNISNEDKSNDKKKYGFQIVPKIGVYIHPKHQFGLLANVDIQKSLEIGLNGFYISYAVGIGYLLQIDDDTNTPEVKLRDANSHFLPTLNLGFHYQTSPHMTVYSKFLAGPKITNNSGPIIEHFLELGLLFDVNFNNKY